jgi:hypothetical protein
LKAKTVIGQDNENYTTQAIDNSKHNSLNKPNNGFLFGTHRNSVTPQKHQGKKN